MTWSGSQEQAWQGRAVREPCVVEAPIWVRFSLGEYEINENNIRGLKCMLRLWGRPRCGVA